MNKAYKDANFRRVVGHRLDVNNKPVPVEIYLYEGKSKIYDIVVTKAPDQYICRIDSRKTVAGQSHKEIDKFFNLGLAGI